VNFSFTFTFTFTFTQDGMLADKQKVRPYFCPHFVWTRRALRNSVFVRFLKKYVSQLD
jgi:hypothetical protein